ncbi:MAG: DedD protein, partial [Campylobacterota bacterium]|nr:DedD protein [Campylobacterota bacterium]
AAITPAPTPAPKAKVATVVAKTQPVENTKKPQGTAVIKQEKTTPAKIIEPKKAVQEAAAPTPAKAVTETKTADVKPAATAAAPTTYYIQVGSFTNEPNKALFDRLNASGMKYTTQKSGSVTKVLVGPFQGEKSVRDAMGPIRQNVEAKAFKIKG